MLSCRERFHLTKEKGRARFIACQHFLKNWLFHPVVNRVVGEKFIALGNLLFIGVVVTEILQVQARAVFMAAGIAATIACYTFGSLALTRSKESL